MNPLTTKLGVIENLFALAHDAGNLIYVNVVKIEGMIDRSRFRQSLDLLQKHSTLLQVHLIKLDDSSYFQSEGTLNIPLKIIEKQNDRQWQKIAENELHQKFVKSKNPLCRFTLIDNCDRNGTSELIVTFHHAIADGVSFTHLLDRLFGFYQELGQKRKLEAKTVDSRLPSIEDLVKDSLLKARAKQQTEIDSSTEAIKAALVIEQEAAPSDRQSYFLCRTIERKSTQILIERCRQEQTTVHGALCAAMLFSAAKHTAIELPAHLSCSSNVNLRKYCQPVISDRHLACLASRLAENHSLTQETQFWDLARECKTKIANSLARGTHLELICSDRLRNFSRDIIAYLANYQMGRDMTVHVSNLGKIELAKQYGNLNIRGIYFVTGQHLFGSCFWLGAITFGGQMFLTFARVFPLISHETAEWFADLATDILEQATISQDLAVKDL